MPSLISTISILFLAFSTVVIADSNTFCKVKRQTGTAAVVLIGTSNPPIVAAEVNPIGDTTPLIGTGGALQDFKKRQTGTAAVVVIGTSNPHIVAAEVNPIGDTTPLIGSGGTLIDFSSSAVPNPANSRKIKRGTLDLNLIPHHVATRGLKGGLIELF